MSLLHVQQLVAGYGPITVLREVHLDVTAGEACVILGVNGAGKTTTLRAISGLIWRRGIIRFDGADISNWSAEKIARAGIGHVPQGRGTFNDLTVMDNLAVGAARRRGGSAAQADLDMVFDLFPRLKERGAQFAGSLSGGEQQMLAIGRALMAAPRLLLLDEPSLGLSPRLTEEIFVALNRLRVERALTMLVVEQNAALSLRIAQKAYVLETGSIAFEGDASAVVNDEQVRHVYLGI